MGVEEVDDVGVDELVDVEELTLGGAGGEFMAGEVPAGELDAALGSGVQVMVGSLSQGALCGATTRATFRAEPANGSPPVIGVSVVMGIVVCVHTYGRSRHVAGAGALEPHVPVDRLDDGTWVYAPVGDVLIVAGGERIVCHACGDVLEAITRHHVRRHDLDLAGYRRRFGLNRKTSLIAPSLAETRRAEGRRRWQSNDGVRDGLAVGQAMAKSGELHAVGVAAQPAGSRRQQGRRAASRDDAAPALTAHRAGQAEEARRRWEQQARALGFDSLKGYLADRRAIAATPWRVRSELQCGSDMAGRLLREGR